MTNAGVALRRKRQSPQLSAFAALLIACALAGSGAWLLLRPIPETAHLTPLAPRPELLDKPHRYVSAASAQPSAR